MSNTSPYRNLQPLYLCFCSNFLFKPMFVQGFRFILIEWDSTVLAFTLNHIVPLCCPFSDLDPDYSTSVAITWLLLLSRTLVLPVVPLVKMVLKSYSWYPNQANIKEIVSFYTKISVTKARGHYSACSYTFCPQKVTLERWDCCWEWYKINSNMGMYLIRVYFSFLQIITKINSLLSICPSSLWCGSVISFSCKLYFPVNHVNLALPRSSEMGVSNEGLCSTGWPLGMSVVNCLDFLIHARKDGALWVAPFHGQYKRVRWAWVHEWASKQHSGLGSCPNFLLRWTPGKVSPINSFLLS